MITFWPFVTLQWALIFSHVKSLYSTVQHLSEILFKICRSYDAWYCVSEIDHCSHKMSNLIQFAILEKLIPPSPPLPSTLYLVHLSQSAEYQLPVIQIHWLPQHLIWFPIGWIITLLILLFLPPPIIAKKHILSARRLAIVVSVRSCLYA